MIDYTSNDVETIYVNEERVQYSPEAWNSIIRGLQQTETCYIGSFSNYKEEGEESNG